MNIKVMYVIIFILSTLNTYFIVKHSSLANNLFALVQKGLRLISNLFATIIIEEWENGD